MSRLYNKLITVTVLIYRRCTNTAQSHTWCVLSNNYNTTTTTADEWDAATAVLPALTEQRRFTSCAAKVWLHDASRTQQWIHAQVWRVRWSIVAWQQPAADARRASHGHAIVAEPAHQSVRNRLDPGPRLIRTRRTEVASSYCVLAVVLQLLSLLHRRM